MGNPRSRVVAAWARRMLRALFGVAVAFALARSAVGAHDDSVDDSTMKIVSRNSEAAIRAVLIKSIFGSTVTLPRDIQPTQTIASYHPVSGDALPPVIVGLDRIEKVIVEMTEPQANGNPITITSTAYIYHPRAPNGEIVVVHQGHNCHLNGQDDSNIPAVIEELVAGHVAVIAMRMPYFQSPSDCGSSADHNALMERRLKDGRGSPIRFFLEPVTRVINFVQLKYSGVYRTIGMMGLSGGGWTTTVYAAIDPRITRSIPVAGSIPLYLRGHSYPDDREQYIQSFYAVAGYKDLYVLGADTPNRSQLQILNRFDNCCFGQPQDTVGPPPYLTAVRLYADDVQAALRRFSGGTYSLLVSETAHSHKIPIEAFQQVALPMLGVAPPHDLEDDGTQMSNMHGCGAGNFMRGVEVAENTFFCMKAGQTEAGVVDTGTEQTFSYGGHPHKVHVCPDGFAMQGLQVARNQLLCTKPTRPLVAAPFIDHHSQASIPTSISGKSMHVCSGPARDALMIGIQAADNVLVCRSLAGA